MRFPGGTVLPDSVAAVCAIASMVCALSCGCDAAGVFRAGRGLQAAAAAAATSGPRDAFQLIDCRNDNDCKPLPNTSCAKDPPDNQTRCLCADSTHPIDGECIVAPQELGMPCEIETHCSPSADCAHNASASHGDFKTCRCRDGTADDDDDDDGTCSGGVRAALSTICCLAVLLAVVLRNNSTA